MGISCIYNNVEPFKELLCNHFLDIFDTLVFSVVAIANFLPLR